MVEVLQTNGVGTSKQSGALVALVHFIDQELLRIVELGRAASCVADATIHAVVEDVGLPGLIRQVLKMRQTKGKTTHMAQT